MLVAIAVTSDELFYWKDWVSEQATSTVYDREKGVCGCLSDNSVLKILKIIRIYLKRLLLKSSKFYVEVALVLPHW